MGRIGLGFGADSIMELVQSEGFLVGYFVVLGFSFVGLMFQTGVFTLIGAICLLCLVCGWFSSDNYHYHTKYLERAFPKNDVFQKEC